MLSIRMVDYLRLAESIAEMQSVFAFTDAEPDDPGRKLNEDEIDHLKSIMQKLLSIAEELDMPVSQKVIYLRQRDVPTTGRELRMLRDVVYSELQSKNFFFVPSSLAAYYDSENALSDKARNAFPRCFGEIRSSGNCLACGEWTASVFHAMRAAESGVRVMGRSLGVEFPDKPVDLAEWQQILDSADSKIKALGQRPKSVERDADQAFFSQAAAQFRYFKNGWRVRVAHARATYSENEALKIYEHVRDFFETLSTRLAEGDEG